MLHVRSPLYVFRGTVMAGRVSLLLVAATAAAAAAVASSQECEWQSDADRGHVLCRPQAIDADFSVGRHGRLPVSAVTSLTVQCVAEEAESRLSNRTMRGLVGLQALTVERCRVTSLPAGLLGQLRQLRSLSLRTFSDDANLVVHSDALHGLQSLQHLDLSHNNIWELPDSLLCPLQGLQSLNLSHNHIQEAEGVGLRGEDSVCRLLALTSLDLSHNRLPTVSGRLLAAFPALQQLSVRGSRVELLADGALDGLAALRQLDLSDNELVTVPRDLLRAVSELTELRLADNRLSALTPGTFQRLGRLRQLDLSGNQLTSTWINSQTFSGLDQLTVLDISNNRLDQLDPSVFSDLHGLQVLRLHHNRIDAIAPHTFASLSSLHTLVMSHNQVHSLVASSLAGLGSLLLLSLDDNKIDVIQSGAFESVGDLRDLKLSGNRLTRVPEAFQDLYQLERLDLGNNYISSISDGALSGMRNLRDIRLQANMLANITQSLLRDLSQLRVFNMANNLVSSIEAGAFRSSPLLEAIRLDGNRLTDISSVFHGLSSLRWLNISDNQIDTFDYAMLPRSVQWLDLHQNKIEQLENFYDVANQMPLTTLDVSFNRLTSLSGKSLPNSAVMLSLNDNLISHVEQYTFFLMANLSRVDLFANQIKNLEMNALRLNILNGSSLPEFYIGGNPFICDCAMEWLQRYNQIERLNSYPRIMDLDSIYCRLVYNRDRAFVPLVDADTSMFLCPYQAHCFTTCHCCEFDACDCEMTCPDRCRCYHDQPWSSNIVDCSSNGFVEIPDRLPMDATEVYLDGNVFSNLSSLTFLGRKNMRVLYLNGSQIEVIQNETFVGLESVTVLHLESNVLTELAGREFVGLTRLRELHLQNNRLLRVAEDTFAPLSLLEVLRLDGNRLATFPAWQLQRNPYLVEIGLAGNRWSCQCDFLTELRAWLTANARKVVAVGSLVCRVDEADDDGVVVYSDDKSCPILHARRGAVPATAFSHLPLLIGLTAVGLLLAAVLVVVWVYREELRVWLHWRCGLRVCHRSVDDDQPHRLFDAFVSYSDRDRAFVQHVLVPKLENGRPPYRLALPDRDFAHSAYLADTIVDAVESSRRTIMVLSKNFVENEWCRFQFKSAHHEVLKDRRKRLVVVMLGDVSLADLDPDLRLCVKTNTCIRWKDKRFWEKLRYALPDVSGMTRVDTPESLYEEIGEGVYYQRSPSTMETLWG